MKTLKEMLKHDEYNLIWERYCGFLDLSLNEFMQIQERLLMEQIEILYSCELGKRLMKKKPSSLKEFREIVPLTNYEDYADILINKKEEMLPSKPLYWIKTTWKGGTQDIKLAPYSESMIEEHAKAFIASLILATSKKRYDFTLRDHDKFLYGMAPLPYLTGLAPYGLKKEIDFEYLPSIEKAESLGFKERNKEGFNIALNRGVDLFFGLSSVLVKIGEDFVTGSSSKKSIRPKNLKMLFKLIRVFIKKNIKKETVLPKDLFDFKGILCAGTDTSAYKEKIEYYFGKTPLEIFGGTEIATVAIETWSRNGLTFFPDVNFLEFIPEKESLRSLNDKTFQPQTILLNELKPNEKYELVITKFRGGAFVRYRVGDMIECLALEDKESQIALPQIRYVDRISNIIDIAGFTRITKSTIEKALTLGNFNVVNWVACKELINNEPTLHLYIELKDEINNIITVKKHIHDGLKSLDSDYRDYETLLGKSPLQVTLLKQHAFTKLTDKSAFVQINPGKEILNELFS